MTGTDFTSTWRDRLASGSKHAAHALANALKEDPSHVKAIAPLAADEHALVHVGALRAMAELSLHHPRAVAAHAREVVQGLAAPEPDAQVAALDALANICAHAPEDVALALPLIEDVLGQAKRPALREAAVRCLGRIGAEVPAHAPEAAHCLADRLSGFKSPRQAGEAREVLAAIESVVPNLPPPERSSLAPRVAALRAHPNLQVRERAGRVVRALGQ